MIKANDSSKPNPHQQSTTSTTGKLIKYAEIVNAQGFALPIKILINSTIASTAVDSLRDSQDIANQLAKDWLIQFLDDKSNQKKFGYFLQNLFSYEPVLSPTRWLVHWSVNSTATRALSLQQLQWQGLRAVRGEHSPVVKKLLASATQDLLRSRPFVDQQVVPLLTWALRDNEHITANTIGLVAWSIPFAKDSAVEGLKYVVTESLKSPDAKKAVKETLIEYIKKLNEGSGGNSGAAEKK